MRLAFKDGFVMGAAKAGLMTVTGGRFPGGRIAMHADADASRSAGEETTLVPDGVLTFSKLDAVFKSGNATRDTIPSHLLVGPGCQRRGGGLLHPCLSRRRVRAGGRASSAVNPPNCVDCKATDVLGPRWTPREGGSGPRYRAM